MSKRCFLSNFISWNNKKDFKTIEFQKAKFLVTIIEKTSVGGEWCGESRYIGMSRVDILRNVCHVGRWYVARGRVVVVWWRRRIELANVVTVRVKRMLMMLIHVGCLVAAGQELSGWTNNWSHGRVGNRRLRANIVGIPIHFLVKRTLYLVSLIKISRNSLSSLIYIL